MASFFQPALNGPRVDRDPNTRFEILWNATLQGSQLTLYWYQIFVITVGCTFFILGCTSLIFQHIRRKWQFKWHALLNRPKHFSPSTKTGAPRDDNPFRRTSVQASESGLAVPRISIAPPQLSTIKSFCVTDHELCVHTFPSNFDLHVVGLTGEREVEIVIPSPNLHLLADDSIAATDNTAPSSSQSTSESLGSTAPDTVQDSMLPPQTPTEDLLPRRTSTIFYGALQATIGVSARDTSEKAALINNLRLKQGLHGIAISYEASDSAEDINMLLEALQDQGVSVILMCDPDLEVVELIHFGLIDGLIIKNASILPNGQRRDFYRAVQVRECVARCKRQLKTRPEFFLGFLEAWSSRPQAATLRRAFKLADFFGAVLQAQSVFDDNSTTEMCLSGFDWLKRPEIIRLQKRWCNNVGTSVLHTSDEDEAHLDIEGLSEVIGPAESYLCLEPLPLDLFSLQNERLESVESPDYTIDAPRRGSLWEHASCGALLCRLGCYSLGDQVTEKHYNRILQTQRGLKRLQMLHIYADIEILAMSKSLKRILEQSSHPKLLQVLLDLLASGHVRIYKGLDSGFSLPDDGGQMLGLSDSHQEDDEQILDIYISLKNTNDAATVWHVFMAHHGISRLERYEEEHLFVPGSPLPKSIQHELEQCTEAELLSLVEQTRLSDTDHPLNRAIIMGCTSLLLEDSSKSAWIALHSRACLDGSVNMRGILQSRLEQFAKNGAHKLPQLDNLMEFFHLLERKLEDALFWGDRATMSQLSGPLVDAYDKANPKMAAECRLDLYGLMYFCALRRLAFEDVYLETTDRCPLFLQQHDQAGVFSELWVLGSQCEIYFGILPRTLGEVIYDRYHRYLLQHPPPPESWDGKDVFTAYSNTQTRIKLEGHGVMTGSGSPVELPGQAPGYRLDEQESTKHLVEATSRFGALSIFCFPAVIDVILLSFLGRGFYLTAYMSDEVVMMANYAILTALLMTGGITGWVGSTGGFYLFSVSLSPNIILNLLMLIQFAFDNMTHFLVQRFSAAFVLTTVVAICGFFAFGAQVSWFAGFIFLIYLYALTTFLNLLGKFMLFR